MGASLAQRSPWPPTQLLGPNHRWVKGETRKRAEGPNPLEGLGTHHRKEGRTFPWRASAASGAGSGTSGHSGPASDRQSGRKEEEVGTPTLQRMSCQQNRHHQHGAPEAAGALRTQRGEKAWLGCQRARPSWGTESSLPPAEANRQSEAHGEAWHKATPKSQGWPKNWAHGTPCQVTHRALTESLS